MESLYNSMFPNLTNSSSQDNLELSKEKPAPLTVTMHCSPVFCSQKLPSSVNLLEMPKMERKAEAVLQSTRISQRRRASPQRNQCASLKTLTSHSNSTKNSSVSSLQLSLLQPLPLPVITAVAAAAKVTLTSQMSLLTTPSIQVTHSIPVPPTLPLSSSATTASQPLNPSNSYLTLSMITITDSIQIAEHIFDSLIAPTIINYYDIESMLSHSSPSSNSLILSFPFNSSNLSLFQMTIYSIFRYQYISQVKSLLNNYTSGLISHIELHSIIMIVLNSMNIH